MKYCIYCGHEIKEETKFCGFCGKSQVPEENKNNVEKNSVNETLSNLKDQALENESVKKAVKAGKNYFTFLFDNIKNPSLSSETYHKYYGYISLVLLALFTSVTIGKGIYSLLNEIGSAFRLFDFSFYNSVGASYIFRIFLYLIVSMMIVGLLSYLTTVKVLGVSYSFSEVITKLFAPMSLAVAISFFTMILVFLKLNTVKLVILGLIIIAVLQQVCYYAFLLDEKNYITSNKNKIYIVILNIACLSILNFCVYKIIGESIISQWFNIF